MFRTFEAGAVLATTGVSIRASVKEGQPDSPTARQPDSPTARQPDSPTARQPDELSRRSGGRRPCPPLSCFIRSVSRALAAALVLLLVAGAAQAQTASRLTGNLDRTNNSHHDFRWDNAQAFTTGSSSRGYRVTAVSLKLRHNQGDQPTYTVSIHSASSSGNPDSSLGTLTTTTTLGGAWADVWFNAPDGGIDLAADTTYFVVVEATGGTEHTRWGDTQSDDEDSGWAGWSIANNGQFLSTISNSWETFNNAAFQLAVHGYAKPPAVSSVEVVSTPSLTWNTGDPLNLYGVGENICVQVTFDEAVTVTGTPQITIDMNTAETWGAFQADYESGSGTANLIFSHTVTGLNRSNDGIAVLENTLALNGGTIVAKSDGTTAAALAHDGLAQDTGHRVNGGAPAASTKTCAQQLAGSGGAAPDTTPPRLVRASVSGDRLRLSFNERLDPASVPAATDFEVTVDGGAPAAPSAVGLSGRVVTLSLAEAVEPGTDVTVSYTPGASPLQDAAGNDVAAFSGRQAVHGAPEAQKRVFAGALASVASRTVSGALDNIGGRLGEAVPSSGLALAGRPMPSGAGGAEDAGRSGGGESRGMAAGELLGSSAFSLALGAAEGGPGSDAAAPRWGVWGRGDLGSFEGRAGAGARYRGDLRTGWLGADARAGRWVAGLAVSRGTSETDYALEGGTGQVETALTALWPYGRWTLANGLELRGLLGAGRGEARHAPGEGAREKSRLTMRAASLGLRQAFAPLEGFELAGRADASFARMETGGGGEAIDGLRADAWRFRGGLEASKRFALEGGASVSPFAELAARRDGGDGVAGSGVELAGGVRYAGPGISVEARGRWLAAHSAKGARERGASATVRLDPEAGGRGLSLALTPRWGAPAAGSGALWREEAPEASGASGGGALDARLGYGFALAPGAGGLLTPFAEAGLAGGDDGPRLRLGTRFEARRCALALELAGERRETAAQPEHAVRLDLRIGF